MKYEKYIGIPFKDKGDTFNGCDCYGLLRLFFNTEFNANLQAPKASAFDTKATFAEFLYETSKNWKPCEPQDYCGVAIANDIRIPHIVQHFGIILPNEKILHTLDKIGSHITDIKPYKSRIKGYYTWQMS